MSGGKCLHTKCAESDRVCQNELVFTPRCCLLGKHFKTVITNMYLVSGTEGRERFVRLWLLGKAAFVGEIESNVDCTKFDAGILYDQLFRHSRHIKAD